jgi:Zn finger protein HypA/HybF involved in hydrogenase expression
MENRPDRATMGAWAVAADTQFQAIFDALLRAALGERATLADFVAPASFACDACAAVLRNDAKFRAAAGSVLAHPGAMKRRFLLKFEDCKLGPTAQMLLFVVKRVQLDVFSWHNLAPVFIRAGIEQQADGTPVDEDLIDFARERSPFFDRFGGFPIRSKPLKVLTSHIDAFAKVFEFAMQFKDDLRRAVLQLGKT